ncbi:MAG TPA: hypothetical protein VKR58_05615 [Aquella sp.]|nr:hypothetical protein [Aquella sp.]
MKVGFETYLVFDKSEFSDAFLKYLPKNVNKQYLFYASHDGDHIYSPNIVLDLLEFEDDQNLLKEDKAAILNDAKIIADILLAEGEPLFKMSNSVDAYTSLF